MQGANGLMEKRKRNTVALAGNPNSGKTTIFNALAGTHQHVGNYPGVTVEIKEGYLKHKGCDIKLVDLPGTYSLTAYSPEELVARNYVVEDKPDLVVDVIDASNLERNLYLATQFMEMGVPLLFVFNMSDVSEAQGYRIDIELLSKLLGVGIIRTVGHKQKGVEELREAIEKISGGEDTRKPAIVHYGEEIEQQLQKIIKLIEKNHRLCKKYDARWLAVKLLEKDDKVEEEVCRINDETGEIFKAVEDADQHIERDFGDSAEIVLADHRYGFISGACQESVRSTVESRHSMSDKIDVVLTNRILGIPIFLLFMYLLFKLTFTLGEPPMGWIEGFFGWLAGGIESLWPAGSESGVKSLLVDGIIGGVGGVLVFLPNILLLFLGIAVLEDSGYMGRAAFIMDRFMHKIGLHGKSFIPMLIGFGCTVPAIMATRTLESRRDRLTTMLVLPLMSCGARLPIYMLFIPAFFPESRRAPILLLIYLIGIVLAIILARVLRSTLFKGESVPFVMELPPYRMPTLKGTLVHMWERGWMFLRKAGTIIVAISVLLWVFTTYPKLPEEQRIESGESSIQQKQLSYSIAGRIGHGLEGVMRPVGFDWKTTTALIGAFAAKEVFVAQLGIVHSVGQAEEQSEALRNRLQQEYTALQAFCIMLFCLISIPCMVTVATVWKESGSWRWPALQLAGLTVLAYVVTLVVYQIGQLIT